MSAPFHLHVSDDLELRQRQLEDAEELFALIEANRAYLRAWLPWLDTSRSVDDTRKNIESSLRQAEAGSGLAVSLWYQGRIVGVTGYNEIHQTNRVGHIGYWLAQEYEGRGLMTASVSALIHHGFTKLGLNRQAISAHVDNVRSRTIAERLGFRLEGIAYEAAWHYDHFTDIARYGLTLREWQHLQTP